MGRPAPPPSQAKVGKVSASRFYHLSFYLPTQVSICVSMCTWFVRTITWVTPWHLSQRRQLHHPTNTAWLQLKHCNDSLKPLRNLRRWSNPTRALLSKRRPCRAKHARHRRWAVGSRQRTWEPAQRTPRKLCNIKGWITKHLDRWIDVNRYE